jgi:hypothetical protein
METQALLEKIYVGFNARDIDSVLSVVHPEVEWPNGMEGGTVFGHSGIRDYWTRQWTLINPTVHPRSFTQEPDGRVNVEVHQLIRDLAGNLLKDATIHHVYAFEDGLIQSMEIREQDR